MLRKVIFNLIKENHGLHEADVIAERMVAPKFNEEAGFFSDSNLNSLKLYEMTFSGNYLRISWIK
jgi:hypothetical protein